MAQLPDFLTALLQDGRVQVPAPQPLSGRELEAADTVLAAFERDYRRALPGNPPALHAASARWGAISIYRACQFTVFRDADEAAMREMAGGACPEGPPPEVHYSVDLSLRFLPDVARLARGIADEDPLVAMLAGWARRWPLSSVGMQGVTGIDLDPILAHPALAALYVDRVIARRDAARLADPRVRDGVRAAMGIFPQLAGELSGAISENSARGIDRSFPG